MKKTIALAGEVNKFGIFDAVIQCRNIQCFGRKYFSVNVLAPYILTSLIDKPEQLIYITSDMQLQGRLKFESVTGGFTGALPRNYESSV